MFNNRGVRKGDDFMNYRIRSPDKKVEGTFGKMYLLQKTIMKIY
jgi:hypothetical protein